MFEALNAHNEYSPSHHVAEMVACLGFPPLEYLRRSKETLNVFDEQGQFSPFTSVSIYLETASKRIF